MYSFSLRFEKTVGKFKKWVMYLYKTTTKQNSPFGGNRPHWKSDNSIRRSDNYFYIYIYLISYIFIYIYTRHCTIFDCFAWFSTVQKTFGKFSSPTRSAFSRRVPIGRAPVVGALTTRPCRPNRSTSRCIASPTFFSDQSKRWIVIIIIYLIRYVKISNHIRVNKRCCSLFSHRTLGGKQTTNDYNIIILL